MAETWRRLLADFRPVAKAAAVRVKAVERNSEPEEQHIWTLFASHAHLRVGRFAPVR